jgi:hypothetical protein
MVVLMQLLVLRVDDLHNNEVKDLGHIHNIMRVMCHSVSQSSVSLDKCEFFVPSSFQTPNPRHHTTDTVNHVDATTLILYYLFP